MRINSAITDIIKPWFQKLEVPTIKAIKPENRWNMDKAGIIEGQGENRLVIGSARNVLFKRNSQEEGPGLYLLSISRLLAKHFFHL
jgi:hypothetical protein